MAHWERKLSGNAQVAGSSLFFALLARGGQSHQSLTVLIQLQVGEVLLARVPASGMANTQEGVPNGDGRAHGARHYEPRGREPAGRHLEVAVVLARHAVRVRSLRDGPSQPPARPDGDAYVSYLYV